MSIRRWRVCTAVACAALSLSAIAQEVDRPDEHAPILVMGDHYHQAGEFMFSYRYMNMSMQGNRDGHSKLSPEQIATSVSNRFFGGPMQPPTLRVVPSKMRMEMHMLGLMYAPSEHVTIMGMLNYVDKEMDHTTFAGPVGSTVLGQFTTRASGLGDTSLSALIRLREQGESRLHLTVGLSVPTGDVDATAAVLAPNGMRPTLRLPYPMQLGSGSYDALLGLTYSRLQERWGYGAQWRSTLRVDTNDEGYRLGDEHLLTAWVSRPMGAKLSWSARMEFFKRGNINGMDPLIRAPVQTADPMHQAASRVDAAVGVNLLTSSGHRLAFELLRPLRQSLDGPQLETDWVLSVGYQLAF